MQASRQTASKIFGYDPKEAGLPIEKLNLLLCGGVGAGKSSIVSLIHSIIKGRTSAVALHGTGTSSVTPDLTKYRFNQPGSTSKNPKPVKWQLWDTMGWGSDDYKGGELAFILDGHLPHGCDLRQRISTKTPKYKVKPSLEEEVHCMCLVVPSNAATDEKYMARLQEMRQAALERRKAAFLLISTLWLLQIVVSTLWLFRIMLMFSSVSLYVHVQEFPRWCFSPRLMHTILIL